MLQAQAQRELDRTNLETSVQERRAEPGHFDFGQERGHLRLTLLQKCWMFPGTNLPQSPLKLRQS